MSDTSTQAPDSTTLMKQERDTIAGLAMLASTYVHFDPPLVHQVGGETKTGHAYGFNVNCLVVDNRDGEAVALERNRIYVDCNPLQHAEQLGVRAAIARLLQKRPRTTSVDSYLGTSLFGESGSAPRDFLRKGCTLYNTYDPCGMCAAMLALTKMKRVTYLFDDPKFEKVYDQLRPLFVAPAALGDSVKDELSLLPDGDAPLQRGATLIRALQQQVNALARAGTVPVTILDHPEFRDDLRRATELLQSIQPGDLVTTGDDRDCNARTLDDVKRLCNLL